MYVACCVAQTRMMNDMMKNNPGMLSMMENMIGGMSQEQLDAMVRLPDI